MREMLVKAQIRRRLAEGWEAWLPPHLLGAANPWVWARPAPRTPRVPFGASLEINDITPDELAVLDEVLQEAH